MITALLIGLALGFFGSVPAAGPLLFLVIDSGLARDRARALSLAAGGALAEAAYVALAFAGAGELLKLVPVSPRALKVFSALIVVVLGVLILRAKPGSTTPQAPRLRSTALLTGFSIVLFNPGFLAFWSVIAAFVYSSGLVAPGASRTTALAAGSGFGIVLWFSSVFALATRATKSVSDERLKQLRRAVGVVLILLGVGLAAAAFLS